jgi:hypothetical protein
MAASLVAEKGVEALNSGREVPVEMPPRPKLYH